MSGEDGPSLRALRTAAGLSLQQVTAVGISSDAYLRLEAGLPLSQPGPGIVMRLAVIFGVTETDSMVALQGSRAAKPSTRRTSACQGVRP